MLGGHRGAKVPRGSPLLVGVRRVPTAPGGPQGSPKVLGVPTAPGGLCGCSGLPGVPTGLGGPLGCEGSPRFLGVPTDLGGPLGCQGSPRVSGGPLGCRGSLWLLEAPTGAGATLHAQAVPLILHAVAQLGARCSQAWGSLWVISLEPPPGTSPSLGCGAPMSAAPSVHRQGAGQEGGRHQPGPQGEGEMRQRGGE